MARPARSIWRARGIAKSQDNWKTQAFVSRLGVAGEWFGEKPIAIFYCLVEEDDETPKATFFLRPQSR